MSALALARNPRSRLPAGGERNEAVLVQRRSTLADQGPVAAPPITEAGRPLGAGTRDVMERGFGRSFADVRVHDDAQAHNNARALDARAYAAGSDLVFAEGAYRPDTSAGDALIAHELAHVVQQGGVQMKSFGPPPAGTDHELERQADSSAEAVLSGRCAPALSRIASPYILRNPAAAAPPAAPTGNAAIASNAKLPPGMTKVDDADRGFVVSLDKLEVPADKGSGSWVTKAYEEAAAGGRLIFSPLITGKTIAAYKEGDEGYKKIWLGKYGFTSTEQIAKDFDAKKVAPDTVSGAAAVKKAALDTSVLGVIKGLATNDLTKAGCDIDHIVEKQLGGTSMASNLQLLTSTKNQLSGGATYQALVQAVTELRDTNSEAAATNDIQIRVKSVAFEKATEDASTVVEQLLRDGHLEGSQKAKADAEGKPVFLEAGGQGETVSVHDTEETPIDAMAKRIVPGMRLKKYKRGPGKENSKQDTVTGAFDSHAMKSLDEKGSAITLHATPAVAAAAAGAAPADGNAASEGQVGTRRVLKIAKPSEKVKFYYPYLSPGYVTKLEVDQSGALAGEGVIQPKIKFLGDLKVRFGKDYLDLVKDIDVGQLNASAPMRAMSSFFRFTEGADNAFKLDLMKFQPSGTVHFSLGPKTKPYVLGNVTAKAEGTTFVAEGTLTTAPTMPGIKDGIGKIAYRSDTGWSGSLKATSSSIKGANADVSMSFSEAKDRFVIAASGTVTANIRNSQLVLGAAWRDGDLVLTGEVTVNKPLPMVPSVELRGRYAKGLLYMSAKPKVQWKMGSTDLSGDAVVNYARKDEEPEGRFSGSVSFIVKNEKMDGRIDLALSEAGKPSGKGELSYQVTKDFRPKLGVELEPTGKIKLSGSAKLKDIKLSGQWPEKPHDRKTILKASMKAGIPTPVPGLRATLKVTGELGIMYSVGPLTLRGLSLETSLYPFEEDKQIKAKLTGSFVMPARGGLYGRFGVLIGADVGYGALSVEGGLYVIPSVWIDGGATVDIAAEYAEGGFSFSGDAFAKGAMFGSLMVQFAVNVDALWGLVGHEWTFPGVTWGPKQIGPEIHIALGKIAYARDGSVTWPSLSQIEVVTPKEFDPMSMFERLISDTVGS
nr:DUF4157 domain-containing protein [uncultured Sphingomonas sp.]